MDDRESSQNQAWHRSATSYPTTVRLRGRDSQGRYDIKVPVQTASSMIVLHSLDGSLLKTFASTADGAKMQARPVIALDETRRFISGNDTPSGEEKHLKTDTTIVPLAFPCLTVTLQVTEPHPAFPLIGALNLTDDQRESLKWCREGVEGCASALAHVAASITAQTINDYGGTADEWRQVRTPEAIFGQEYVIVDTADLGIPNGHIYEGFYGMSEESKIGFTSKGQFGRWTLSGEEKEKYGIDWVAVAPVLCDVPSFVGDKYDIGAAITVRKASPVGYESQDDDTLEVVQTVVGTWGNSDTVAVALQRYNRLTPESQYEQRQELIEDLTGSLNSYVEAMTDGLMSLPVGPRESVIR